MERLQKNYLFSESLEAVELAIDVVAVVVDGTTKGVFKPNSWPKLRGKNSRFASKCHAWIKTHHF